MIHRLTSYKKNAQALAPSLSLSSTCVSGDTGCRGGEERGERGREGGMASFVVTVKAGIESAGLEQARKE